MRNFCYHVFMNFRSFLSFIWSTLKLVVIALAITLPIRYFVIQPFFVLGASMEPTFHNGDYLIINEISYFVGQPSRGDVIVFRYPYNTKEYYIKRVIGLPGETIEIHSDRITIKNNEHPEGFALREAYLPPEITGGDIVKTLGPDEYFVLGDNREASSDSRSWGPLKREFITGKVWIRAFPFDHAEAF